MYLLALGLVAGPAYTMYVHYDFSHSLDTRSYLSIARGEFKGVSITRRYRVLVPWAAAVVAWPLEQVYAKVWPHRAASEWPLRLGYYVVNCLLMAGFGLILFRTCQLYGAAPPAAALAVAAVLTSRWAVYTAGLPLVDSLYLVVFALAFYAVRSRSATALATILLLGPHAKESFVFLLPWLLVFAHRALPWHKQLLWLLLGSVSALALRYWIDTKVGAAPSESINNALSHADTIGYSIRRLFSVKGAGELFSVFGFFSLALLAGLWSQTARAVWLKPLGLPALGLCVVVGIHMLLSGDLGRMGYLAAPVFAVAFSLLLTHLPVFRWVHSEQESPH
ncbi:hypothetical protein GCM10027346_15310 [Hymenobacter seoulensis]